MDKMFATNSVSISLQQQLLTGLASDDHGLHDEGEEFVQHQMEEEDQRL